MMEVNYSLEHDDFLTQYLYRTSKDKILQAKRQKQWILLPVVCAIIAVYFYLTDLKLMALAMAFYMVITLLFYKKYFDYKYKKHFDNHIKTKQSQRIGKKLSVQFKDNFILTKDEAGESKIKTDQFDYISDLPQHFLVYLKLGEVLIIPKSKVDAVALKNMFVQQGHVIIDESNWKWGQNNYS